VSDSTTVKLDMLKLAPLAFEGTMCFYSESSANTRSYQSAKVTCYSKKLIRSVAGLVMSSIEGASMPLCQFLSVLSRSHLAGLTHLPSLRIALFTALLSKDPREVRHCGQDQFVTGGPRSRHGEVRDTVVLA
ncbi:hypothetical protein DNTS_033214, partial [Danionella cerebrum]